MLRRGNATRGPINTRSDWYGYPAACKFWRVVKADCNIRIRYRAWLSRDERQNDYGATGEES